MEAGDWSGGGTVVTLTTDKGVRRFCSRCKKPMKIARETGEIFAAHCPEEAAGHDAVLEYTSHAALIRYEMEVFPPGKPANSEAPLAVLIGA